MIPHIVKGVLATGGRGWIGQYSYPTSGKARTELVRDDAGRPRFFQSEASAALAAGRALCRALNSEVPPAAKSGVRRTLLVSNAGGRQRLRETAETLFQKRGV